MNRSKIFLENINIYCVGIKGTGMCAMAELLKNSGFKVSGSDTNEIFYTDKILKELQIPYYENFDASHINNNIDLIIYSAAYNENDNPELAEAKKKSIKAISYPQALGEWSKMFDSTGIAGVHGKTSTTAIAGIMAKKLNLPVQVLVGSAVKDFNERSTVIMGNQYFIAETCEYRKHFLLFQPKRIIITSVESDHQDFFPDYISIRDAFVEYCKLLPDNGQIIYCADDKGAAEIVDIVKKDRNNINYIPYGFNANGLFKIEYYYTKNEEVFFKINAYNEEFVLHIPGKHLILNATAAIALCINLLNDNNDNIDNKKWEIIKKVLYEFKGSKRRSEILGEENGILFMDDYGHHPTAINATLKGLKEFYPNRRIIISFMSHTYTRTDALLKEFSECFEYADIVFLHKIYSSAREKYNGGITGITLYEKVKLKKDNVYYTENPLDAVEQLKGILQKGDLFITMGAGNNWPLGLSLYNYYKDNNL